MIGPWKKIRLWPRSRWARIVTALMIPVVLPYAFSRAMSPWRLVTVHDSGVATGSDTGDALALRVCAYNLAHGRGLAASNWDGGTELARRRRLDDIAGLLTQIDADIVILNEVDFDSSWSNSVNQARYLAERAGYRYCVEQRNFDFRVLFWTWRSGNALLSRLPVSEVGLVDFPGYSLTESVLAGKKRGLTANVRVGDDYVRIIGAHMSHRSESLRVATADRLLKLLKRSECPTIIAGDLNSTPTGFPRSSVGEDGRNAIDVLDASGAIIRLPHAPPGPDGLTFHSSEPRSVIDWIIVPGTCEVSDYCVEHSLLSDHRPVHALVNLSRSFR